MFSFNEKYLIKDGKPWFPIMGEFHYTRYPQAQWREALMRMKAGGLDVVSTYVIWIHHEEAEGEYNFSGNHDLRRFIELCKEVGIYAFLRIGPWVHGEVRNGGFPDWLLKKPFEVRANNDNYFAAVEKFYCKIFEQVKGTFFDDGGAIIGVQIENECGHCGGPVGEAGEEHMRRLTQMAKTIGFNAPLYTATGWGGAVTGGNIPVMGGYCEAPWDQRLTKIEPSGNYIFTNERNDHNIGSDYGFGEGITFDMAKFPYLTAELGGGLQVTHHRRPVAHAADIGAMTLAKLGSGVNLLGYYMYHGGTNPHGKYSTLQESRATGYLNDLPIYNYDFNAPLKEYGQPSETFYELRLYSLFLQDFGEDLCKMPADIPAENPLKPDNFTDLRYSFRHNGKSGYLFVNNFQRSYKMSEHDNVSLSLVLDDETIKFPTFSVKNGDYFFSPFNMKIGDALLKTTLATPLCVVGKTYFFYANGEVTYDVEGELGDCKIVTLTREQAKKAYKIAAADGTYLVIADGLITDEKPSKLFSGEVAELTAYPAFSVVPLGFEVVSLNEEFAIYRKTISEKAADAAFSEVSRSDEKAVYEVTLNIPQAAADCILNVEYSGDYARLLIDGELQSDSFYTGEAWQIGLKRFSLPRKITLEIYPLDKNAGVYLDYPPDFGGQNSVCRLDGVTAAAKYETIIEV